MSLNMSCSAGSSCSHASSLVLLCAGHMLLQVFHCADAFATIVVVDASEGRPSPIPFELQPATEEEKLRLEVRSTLFDLNNTGAH